MTLISALYVILAPVGRHLVVLAAFFGIVAVSVSVMLAAHSFDLAAGSLATLIFPGLSTTLYPGYMVPMFFFEVGLGVLLLAKGLRRPAVAPA